MGPATQRVVYATRVAEEELCRSAPWLVQEYVEAEKDVTVAVVRDRLFAFELPRGAFLDRTVDWRELQWHNVPAALGSYIFDLSFQTRAR